MNFFSSEGMLVQLPADSKVLSFALEDDSDPSGFFNFRNRMGIITSFANDENALVQLRQMFNNKMYLNVFGDNPGVLSVGGLFAGRTCNTVVEDDGSSDMTGFECISGYYRSHRASRRLGRIKVAIGGFWFPVTYSAFLFGCKLSAVDPQLQVGQFSLNFVYPMDTLTAEEVIGDLLSDESDPAADQTPTSPGDESLFLP